MEFSQLFTDFIDEVYEDLVDQSQYSKAYLSGWFLADSNLGKLNASIDSCYEIDRLTGVSGVVTGREINPWLGAEEQSIYKKLFDYEYFNRQAKYALSGVGGRVAEWVSIKEGDSSVTRVNKSEMAKTLKGMARDAKDDLDSLIKNYLRFRAVPQQVVGDDEIYDSYYSPRNYNPRFRNE
jgi:hypothetical protein